MTKNPHEESNSQRRQELQSDEESFRLQQAEERLESGKKNAIFYWIINSISRIVTALEFLLALRFLLRFFGANEKNTFAQFIYTLSDPFIAPFSTLFISPVFGGGLNIFDVNILIAIVVYAILGWLIISMFRLFSTR
jgi:uncharacterized protein YggT (Ycf19 family)